MVIKLINVIKDAFLVYDDYKDSGQRLSKHMVTGGLMVVFSALVAVGAINENIGEEEAAIIGAGIFAAISMVQRLLSKGGKIKVRDHPKPGVPNPPGPKGDSDADEHVPNLPDYD